MTRLWIGAVLLSSLSLAGAAPAQAEGPGAPMPAVPAVAKKAAKIPFRALKAMPDTSEALLIDRASGETFLVTIGDDLGEYQVIDVDDEEVVLWKDGREIVLAVDPAAKVPAAVLAHRPPVAVEAPAA